MMKFPRTLLSSAILALAATATAAGCAAEVSTGGDSSFEIINDSSYVLTEVHISEVGDRSWGPNLLPDVLFPGESLLVTNIDCGTYDVMVTDETGVDCVLGNVDLCFDDDAWVVTDTMLDVCAFAQ
jgi:hypothetical protein